MRAQQGQVVRVCLQVPFGCSEYTGRDSSIALRRVWVDALLQFTGGQVSQIVTDS